MRKIQGLLALMLVSATTITVAQSASFTCEILEGNNRSKASRIIGGQDSSVANWPWQVAVLPRGNLCGGSLIHRQWVLTAAHCLAPPGLQPAQVKVRAGSSRFRDGGQELMASHLFVHPGFNKGKAELQDDIALIRLERPVDHPAARVVQLPSNRVEQTFAFTGACAVVTGWGVSGPSEAPTQSLQKVDVPIADFAKCNANYGGRVSQQALCAGYEAGGKDSCQGDSGGPLVVTGGPTGWTQAGIVSWGDGCGRAGKPGVYTRVAPYIEWIQKTVDSVP